MLLGRSNNNKRGSARGQSSNRSRGTRGRGSTSRGAIGSSKKQNFPPPLPLQTPSQGGSESTSSKALYDRTNTSRGSNRGTGGYKGKNFDPNYRNKYQNTKTAAAPSAKPTNPFEQERLENASKREQRGQNGIIRGVRGNARGTIANKSVRFDASTKSSSRESSPASSNPFGTPFANSSTTPATGFNPFAPTNIAASTPATLFGASTRTSATANPFGSPGVSTASNSLVAPPNKLLSFNGTSAMPQSSSTKNSLDDNRDGSNDIQQLLRSRGIIPPAWPKDPGNPKQKAAMETIYHAHKGYQAKARACLIQAGKLDDPDVRKTLAEAIDFRGTCEEMCPEFEKITRIVEHDVPNPEKDDAPDGTRWPAPHKMIKALARSAAGQDAPLPEQVRTPAALRRTFDYLIHTVLGDEGDLKNVHGYLWDRTRAIRRDFVFQQASMTPAGLRDYVYCLEGITRFHAVALHQMSKLSEDGAAPEDFSEHQELEQLGKTLISLFQAYEDCNAQGVECENENEFRAYYVLNNSHSSGILETVQDWGYKYWSSSEDIKIAVQLVELLQNTWDTRGPLKPHSASEVALNSFSRFFAIISDRSISYTMACLAETKFNEVRKAALKTILSAYRKQRDQTKDWTLSTLNEYLYFDDEEDIIPFGEAYGLRFDEVNGEYYLSFDSDEITDPFPQYKQPHSDYLVESKRGACTLPQVIDNTVYDESEEITYMQDTAEEEEEEMFIRDESKPRQSISATIPKNGDGASVANSEYGLSQPTSAGNGIFGKVTAPSNQSIPEPSVTTPAPSSTLFTSGTSPATQVATAGTGSSIFSEKPAPKTFSDIFQKASTDAPASITATPTQKDFASLFPPQAATVPPVTSVDTPLSGVQTLQPTPAFSFSSSPLSQPAVSTSPSSPLSLGQHAVTTPGNLNELPPTLGNHSIVAPSATSMPKPPPALGNHTIEAPDKVTTPLLQLPPSQVPLSSDRNNLNVPTPGQTTPGTADIQETTFQFPSTSANGMIPPNPTAAPAPPSAASKKMKMDGLSDWFTLGEGGIIDQFQEFAVNQILRHTVEVFKKEQKKRLADEAAALARQEADWFRYEHLATKYCQLWRENARRLWLKRKGRAARKARQEMAEKSFRASQIAKSVDVVEEFRTSTSIKHRSLEAEGNNVPGPISKTSRTVDANGYNTSRSRKRRSIDAEDSDARPTASKKRRNSLESLLHASGVLDGVHNLDDRIRKIVHDELPDAKNKRHKSTRSTNSPGSSSQTQSQRRSDDPMRRSILSDPSYLSGGSRILLIENYGLADDSRRQVSGVKTDYFRLKARGITTLPNGTPLASSAAKNILHHKRSFDGINKPVTPKVPKSQPVARSVPAKLAWQPGPIRNSEERNADIQALKAKAKNIMEEDKHKRRSLDPEEEELFAKARRIREQMDEGAEWFRKEIERSGSASSP